MKRFLVPAETAATTQQEEVKIAQLLADDKRVKEIAAVMGWSEKKTSNRLEAMRKKFDCRSAAGIVSLFYRSKLIE